MKLPSNPTISGISADLLRLIGKITQQVNSVTEGKAAAIHNAATAAPTTGDWNIGDFVKNSAPAELNASGVKYCVIGWECTVSGTPGTWVEIGGLTDTGGGGARFGRGIDTTDDIIIDDSSSGLVLKSPDAHYWRVQVTNAGALTVTDLGTTKP